MKIEFNNTYTDLLRFNASHQFRNIACQGLFLIIASMIFYSEYALETPDEPQSSLFAALSTAIIWYIAIWILQLLFNAIYLYSKNNRTILTTHTVELQDDSFYEETSFNRSHFYWHGISKIIKIAGFIAVYVTPHSAVIIPNRAFKNSEQKEHFYKQLKMNIENT